MTRSEFTLKTKGKALARTARCGKCGEVLGTWENIQFDHNTPDAMGGDNSLENCVPLCLACHALKTNGPPHTSAGSDKNIIAKHDRLTGKTKQGPKKQIQNRGFQTNKQGPFKQKLDGAVEKR